MEGREKEQRRGRPPKPNPSWEGGRPPLSFFPPLSSFPLLLLIGKGGPNLLGVGLPPPLGRASPLGRPSPPYIKGERRRGPAKRGARPRGGGKPTPSRFGPPFLLGVGEGRKRGEGRRKGGPAPLPIRIGLGGRAPSFAPSPSFPLRPNKAHILTGGFR